MSLKNKLEQITEAGFNKMPQPIAQIIADGITELKNSDLKAKALKVGDNIPNIPLIDSNNNTVALTDFIKEEFLVLNFYRGGWCPYCNLELRAYEQLMPKFNRNKTNIVAISGELPNFTQQTAQKNLLSFPVLTDQDGTLMEALGIKFALGEKLREEYKNFGLDLNRFHGNTNQELMVPAVYIIDKNLKIVFAHIEEDYMTRAEPQEVLDYMTVLT